jgi:hypothetical protein
MKTLNSKFTNLEVAFTTLITDWTIQRMINEHKFHHSFPTVKEIKIHVNTTCHTLQFENCKICQNSMENLLVTKKLSQGIYSQCDETQFRKNKYAKFNTLLYDSFCGFGLIYIQVSCLASVPELSS